MVSVTLSGFVPEREALGMTKAVATTEAPVPVTFIFTSAVAERLANSPVASLKSAVVGMLLSVAVRPVRSFPSVDLMVNFMRASWCLKLSTLALLEAFTFLTLSAYMRSMLASFVWSLMLTG